MNSNTDYGSTDDHGADELMTDPPANLSKRGLAMLEEIWIVAGRPAKPKPKRRHGLGDDDGTWFHMVGVDKLEYHFGRRPSARIRVHLMMGGYLHMTEFISREDSLHDRLGMITKLGLSAKAFDALIEAGILKP
jgi:hypothetical protein